MKAAAGIAAAAALSTGLVLTACGTGGGAGATLQPAASSSSSAPVIPVTAGTVRTITVVGTGTVTARPDIAVVNLGVVMTGATVIDAVNAAQNASGKLVTALVAAGVARDDVVTTDYGVGQHWNPATQRNEGWEVRDGFTAVVRDPGKAGGVVARAAAALPNVFWVGGIRFDRSSTTDIAGPARDAAMKDAAARAAAWAQLAGRQLGDVVSVSEAAGSATYTTPPTGGMGGGGAAGVVTGNGQYTVSVTVVYQVS